MSKTKSSIYSAGRACTRPSLKTFNGQETVSQNPVNEMKNQPYYRCGSMILVRVLFLRGFTGCKAEPPAGKIDFPRT